MNAFSRNESTARAFKSISETCVRYFLFFILTFLIVSWRESSLQMHAK